MISEELKEQNYNLFLKKLEQLDVCTTTLVARLGDKLKNATYGMDAKLNNAYDGALLNIVLRTLTPTALKINETLPENIKVEKCSLIKVCLLHQISKAEMFIPNDNDWEREKRGILYKYADCKVAFKCGMRSLLICNQCHIELTDEEVEALTIMDREDDDLQAKFYANPISVVIRQANEITNLVNRLEKKDDC